MGLFDQLKTVKELSPQEAFLGMMYGITVCDDNPEQAQLESLAVALTQTRLFGDCTQAEVAELAGKLNKICAKNGIDFIFQEAARVLTPEQKKAAFVMAVDLAYSDGDIGDAEEAFLQGIYQFFEIPEEFAGKVIEVVQARHGA